MSKQVLLITDVSFWNKSAGSQTRIWELAKYIGAISALTVVFVGTTDEEAMSKFYNLVSGKLVTLNNEQILSAREYGVIFEAFIQRKKFDVCIIEYIHNAYFLNYLPEGTLTILDAHDIISERSKGFRNYTYGEKVFEMDEETEYEIFDMFDYVIFLTENDFLLVGEKIDKKKILLCPHPVKSKKPVLRRKVTHIGFIGSGYLPNIDAAEYFIDNCWPLIIKKYPDLTFIIYGNVVKGIQKSVNDQSIVLSGFVENLDKVYEEIDIIVNPVRFGAGLKIKNVEALANGLPLITTSHGASGLERIINKGFLVADNPEEFLKCFTNLVEDISFRKGISNTAISYAAENFDVEKCFYHLKQLIYQNA